MTAVGIKTLEQIGIEAWNGFVGRHPLSSVYHHAAWHEAIERTYGYKGSYCVLETGGSIEAALPFVLVQTLPLRNRLVAYPFSDSCDPLVRNRQDLEALTKELERFRGVRGARSAEIRTYRLHEKAPGAAIDGSPRYCDFVLDLQKESKTLFRSFHKDCVQRAIKKAQDSSIDVSEAKAFDEMKDFYRLHVLTRKRLGVPVQPFRFFRSLWDILYPLNMLSLFVARVDGKAVAAVVELKFRETVYYKFAAADRQFVSKRPNHLIIWRMIQKAIEEGFTSLDFGRTYVGDQGLMQWKGRWGTERRDFAYIYPSAGRQEIRFNQEGNKANEVANTILSRMPCFVVRLSGELFYKYFA